MVSMNLFVSSEGLSLCGKPSGKKKLGKLLFVDIVNKVLRRCWLLTFGRPNKV